MSKKPALSAEQLVADYQTAFVAVATAQVAHAEAQRSENDLMQQLGYWSRSGYLQPGAIESNQQYDVSRASLDAHVKKVQAQQVDEMKAVHLQEIGESAQTQFVGKKVSVEALNTGQTPFDVLWFSPQTGYRSNELKKRRVTGTVQEVALDKNILLLKPPGFPRWLNKDLAAYVVYVIDPATAQPAVTIKRI